MKKKNWIFWILAILITTGAAYYQRVTGPSYSKIVKFEISGNQEKFVLLRSHAGKTDCLLELPITDNTVSGNLFYKKYPSNDKWTEVALKRKNDTLFAFMPNQPKAGKLVYYIELDTKSGKIEIEKDKPVIIRFRGDVPAYVMIPHIFFIFFAMLISNLAGLFAIGKRKFYLGYGKIAFLLLLIGGMILGPIVQKFAFNEFWAGVPFGWDLTDNKTLIAFIGWIIALVLNWKKERRWAVIGAAILMIIIFSIPHSMFGSELDHTTGVISQG